jgi:hypothetical protein
MIPQKYTTTFCDVRYSPLLVIASFLFFAAIIPVTVSAKTTKIVKIKKCLMGMKNENITPQQIEYAMPS